MSRLRFSSITLGLSAVVTVTACSGSSDLRELSAIPAEDERALEELVEELDETSFADRLSDDLFVVECYRVLVSREPDAIELVTTTYLMRELRVPRSQVVASLMTSVDSRPMTYQRISESSPAILHLLAARSETVAPWSSVPMRPDESDLEEGVDANASDVMDLDGGPVERPSPSDPAGALGTQSALNALSPSSAQALSSQRDSSKPARGQVSSWPHEVFNVYYGSVHHHTKHSDGRGSLEEALRYARYVGGLDFLGLSDHAELIAFWPWSDVWERTRAAVDRATQEGVFVAIAGFEWSSPVFGHINVVHSRDVAWGGAIGYPTMGAIARFVESEPTAFAKYNHPGRADFLGLEFEHFRLRRSLQAQMVGIEVANAHDGFGRYHDTDGYRDDDGGLGYIDEAIGRGWWVAPQAELDAHDLTWRGQLRQRTGVLARALTRDEILEAYRRRRFFATEDENAAVDLRIDGYAMGSELPCPSNGSVLLTIRAWDQDGELFEHLQVVLNGRVAHDRRLNRSRVDLVDLRVSCRSSDYVYVRLKQQDGDELLSGPIRTL